MKILHAIAAVLLCVLLGMGSLVLLDVHRTVPATAAKINLDLDEIHRATLEIGLTAENLRKASAAWQSASQTQAAATSTAAAQLNANLAELHDTLAELHVTIARTDSSLNGPGGVLLQLAGAGEQLTADEKLLEPVLANASAAAANAARLSADPAIAGILANLNATSSSTAGTAANIDATTGDIRAFVHRETAPVKGTWNVIKSFLMEFAGPVAEIFTASHK